MFPSTIDLVNADRDHRLEEFHDRSQHHSPAPAGATTTVRPVRRHRRRFHLPAGAFGR